MSVNELSWSEGGLSRVHHVRNGGYPYPEPSTTSKRERKEGGDRKEEIRHAQMSNRAWTRSPPFVIRTLFVFSNPSSATNTPIPLTVTLNAEFFTHPYYIL